MDTKSLYFPKPILTWDEAVSLGNGICGALVWGTADCLHFSLDRSDIWDNIPSRCTRTPGFSYDSLVRFVAEGRADRIDEVLEAPCVCDPAPTKLPVGRLALSFADEQELSSRLDLRTAEAVVCVGDHTLLRTFLHAEQNIGFLRIHRSLSDFSVRLEHPRFGSAQENQSTVCEDNTGTFDSLPAQSLQRLCYPPPHVVTQADTQYFTQQIPDGICYGVFVRLRERDGWTELAYSIAASTDGPNWAENVLAKLEHSLEEGYETAFSAHKTWWSKYWSKSSLFLPDKFFEKNWYLTQYFLACCSRKGGYPMPLQGVWTADNGELPPWKGDYHLDLNVEMGYLSYLKANHHEEGMPLFDFMWELRDTARRFARSFYGADGICMPSTITITGDTLGGWAGYSFSPTNQLWICHMFYRHFCATGDREFLRDRAYPYMEESARFLLSILKKKNGKYVLPLSTSPEIHDNTLRSYLTPNSNYDLALMRSLFTCLAQSSHELNNGEENRWLDVLRDLPSLAVNKKGALMLSPDEELQESHRHMSHAIAVYPLQLIPYEGSENRRIIDATLLDLQRLGTGFWVGYSFAWAAELYAVQKNGNAAAYQLEVFWHNYCSPNGFHLNGDYKNRGTSVFHYRPFTLEGNFCAADAVQEMLLYTHNSEIELFPAIPDTWREDTVSFSDFCGENGLLISARMQKGIVTSLILKPRRSGTIRLRITECTQAIAKHLHTRSIADARLSIYLEGGHEYKFSLADQPHHSKTTPAL